MNNENSKLGQHYKETFSDFRQEPSPAVWESIAQHPSLAPAPIAKTSLFSPGKLIIGAAVVTTIAVVTWLTISREPNSNPVGKATETAMNKPDAPESSNLATHSQVTAQPGEQEAPEPNTNTSRPGNAVTKTEPAIAKKTVGNITAMEQPAVIQQKTPASAFSGISSKPADQVTNIPSRKADVNPEPLPAKASFASSPVAVSPDQMICKGESTTVWASGGESYLWNNGQTLASITVSPDVTTVYTVTITDAIGEVTSEDVLVTVSNCQDLYVPNAFTPDGDTYNDIFKAFGEDIQKFNMMIFARQGQSVFESNDISQGWDGKVRGSMGEPGVYIYKITYTNAKGESRVKTGQVNLIR